MKIFPEKDYSIELNKDSSLAISELKNQTLSKEQFVTNWNNQSFIGKVETNEFEVKLSKKLNCFAFFTKQCFMQTTNGNF